MSGGLHHVEVWIADPRSESWTWLLDALGWQRTGEWPEGCTWEAEGAYLTLTTSPNLSPEPHDRRRPGVNHLAFCGGSPSDVDAVMAAASAHGWTPLYDDRYPHAGGPDHHAGWLEDGDGFKVEVVADPV